MRQPPSHLAPASLRPAFASPLARLAGVAALIVGLSSAAGAADHSLTDLRFDLGFMRIDIPRMEVRDTPLSREDITAILTRGGPDIAASVARLQAATVTIPEVIATQSLDSVSSVTRYRDLSLSNITAGVIGGLSVGAIEGTASEKAAGVARVRIGQTTAEALNLPLIARVLTSSVPDPSAVAMAPIMRSLAYRDFVTDLPEGKGRMSIDRVTLRDTMARPSKAPVLTAMNEVIAISERQKAAGGGDKLPNAADMASVGRIFGFLENFEYGVGEAEGLRGESDGDAGKGRFEIARIRFSDQAQAPGFVMSGLKIEVSPGKMSIDELEMRDFSIRNALRAAIEMLERGDATALITDYKRLIPQLGTIRVKGFSVQDPEPKRPQRGKPPEIFRASVKAMEIGFGGQIDGVPTALRFSAEEFAAPLSANSEEQGVRDLVAMGYKDVNLSWLADLAWQRDTERLDIKALNISGKEMLGLTLSGQLSGVSKDAFSTDSALAQVAWLSAAAQRVSLVVQNLGGFEKFIAREAAKARKQPDAVRREWGMLAAVGLPAILGDSDGAKALTGAIARFVARPGTLSIDLRARSASGIGVADAVGVMAAPKEIFDKIEVQAKAE